MKNIIILMIVAQFLYSCNSNKEPFSDKLAIEISYEDVNGNFVNQATGTSFTVSANRSIIIMPNIGGEDGFGSDNLQDVVKTLEITAENSGGIETCIFMPLELLGNAATIEYPIAENTKLTFTLTSVDNEVSEVGPIEFTVNATNTSINGGAAIRIEGDLSIWNPRFFAPILSPVTQSTFGHSYHLGTKDDGFLSPKMAVLAAANQNGTIHLISPSEFSNFNTYADYNTRFGCWNVTKIETYYGAMELSDDETINDFNNYAGLDTLSFSNNQYSVPVVANTYFKFETEEGKKGLGKFRNLQNPEGADFVFQMQR